MSNNIAKNIKFYRHRAGYTQDELSAISGVSLATVKKIEGGKTEARRKTIDAIAVALSVEAEKLFKTARRLTTIRFRSCRNMRSKEGIVSEIINKLDKCNTLENITGSYLEKLYRQAEFKSLPAEAAAECRRLLELGNINPVPDVTYAINKLGFKLFAMNIRTDKFFSLSVGEQDGGPAIIVNENERISYEQAVFSIAHELGHFFLHQFRHTEITDEIIWAEEDEADLFASHFLMPEEGFKFFWEVNRGLNWVDRVIKVKQIFGVHYKTVLHRLGNFERLSKDFLKAFPGCAKDGADPESLGKKLYPESRLTDLYTQAVQQNKLTSSQKAEYKKLLYKTEI